MQYNIISQAAKFSEQPIGEPESVCPVCGKTFQQFFIADKNRYTAFKSCPKCRAAERKKKPTEGNSEVVNVTLEYTPHPAQQKIHASNARFKVLDCGSRFGKDRCTIMEGIKKFLEMLNEERGSDMVPTVYWWIVAPTERMAKQNWSELKRYFPKDFVQDVSNSGMILYTDGGGIIEVRSAYDPESLVGVGLDYLSITEAARIADLDVVWANLEQRLNSPGRGPGGKGGLAMINSSPNGMNDFYKLWKWGQKDDEEYDPDWESWKFTTWDNPEMRKRAEEIKVVHGIPLSYKERLRRRIGDRRYRQDILAEFLGDSDKCFPLFNANCVEQIPAGMTHEERLQYAARWKEHKPYKQYVAGYDPASKNDAPPLGVFERDTGRLVFLEDMRGMSWTEQYNEIARVCKRWNAVLAFGRTGHETIDEELKKRGVVTSPFNEQGNNKADMVQNLAVITENKLLKVLDDGTEQIRTYIAQMNDYGKKRVGGRIVFSNIMEPHDDYVSMTYFAMNLLRPSSETTAPFVGIMAGI